MDIMMDNNYPHNHDTDSPDVRGRMYMDHHYYDPLRQSILDTPGPSSFNGFPHIPSHQEEQIKNQETEGHTEFEIWGIGSAIAFALLIVLLVAAGG